MRPTVRPTRCASPSGRGWAVRPTGEQPSTIHSGSTTIYRVRPNTSAWKRPMPWPLRAPTECPTSLRHSAQKQPTAPSSAFASRPLSAASPGPLPLLHYNGLPPAGPRMCPLRMTAPLGAKGPAPAHFDGASFVKPAVGEVDDVVQAHPADKAARPDAWHTWRFEVRLLRDGWW